MFNNYLEKKRERERKRVPQVSLIFSLSLLYFSLFFSFSLSFPLSLIYPRYFLNTRTHPLVRQYLFCPEVKEVTRILIAQKTHEKSLLGPKCISFISCIFFSFFLRASEKRKVSLKLAVHAKECSPFWPGMPVTWKRALPRKKRRKANPAEFFPGKKEKNQRDSNARSAFFSMTLLGD